MAQHPAYTIGALCAIGGTIGYVKSRSTPSLVAGLAFGGLFIASGYMIQTNANYGVELATATSALLLLAMGPRAARTQKPVPLLLSTMGAVGSAYYGMKLNQQYNGV
ncbi:hypothetical protein SmJEL517_g04097 [Synchytrium microbalum]|uniref:Uncharacterized protein n=1 Tax=Synchytrium microbalum TaxID=1806994 RepID=A0A507C4K3_9FUNG|nr:uncharacterized protein SmJEL517_g04097 [Synchytrium microbalum]TPX32926.1 hypothetical protein SmJEL517_g04097 [Synchytrium microbalum]